EDDTVRECMSGLQSAARRRTATGKHGRRDRRQNMFLKKAMAWILTAMLVFPLAACGSQPATLSGTEEESASSAGQETPDGSPAETELPAGESDAAEMTETEG